MTTTALQKPWMKDLPPADVEFAKKRAIDAVKRLQGSFEERLRAYKDVADVNARLGKPGNPDGAFTKWVEAELKPYSVETASRWSTIGQRYDNLFHMCNRLPDSWGTLYELARAPDDVFKVALPQMNSKLERSEVVQIVDAVIAQLHPEEKPKRKRAKKQRKPAAAAQDPMKPPENEGPAPREARTVVAGWSSWFLGLRGLFAETRTAIQRGAMSPESKAFIVNNYLEPGEKMLAQIRKELEP